jgi:predicted nucleic acid-binding protein
LDKTLKTLHLRLDSTSKSLTKNAVSQLIIKILYLKENPVSFQEIEKEMKVVLKASIDKKRVEEGIEKLIKKEEIKYEKKSYSLTRSNRRSLDKKYKESNERLNRIIEKYFHPFHSDKREVIEWFSDATIEFFKSYSNEWVSDLCYTGSQKLKFKREDIFKHIERRTRNNKKLNNDDHSHLVKNFIDCLIYKKDPDLDAHLWEYGTSAFAANLLQSSMGADPISISAFRESKCVLDTNVLMNIGLEASEFHHAIKKLDEIFQELDITPGYFHITEQEYINTVANLNKEILRSVSKFSFSVIKETDDPFIQSAIKRKCHLYEDFEVFCQEISMPPATLNSEQEIIIFNNDVELDKEIELAQQDQQRKDELNAIYKKVTGKDKREAPLVHDVGLIAGIEYYRRKEKAFILSQEISVNKYAHLKPTKGNLPLAIKLETLINMLAIDNGGTAIDPTDYSNLFADMVRLNLQPDKNTFEITDLSKLLDTELQIEQLPADEVISIANRLHDNIGKGMSEEEISLELNRQFQEVKLKFVDDLGTAREELSYEKSEKEKHKKQAHKTHLALRNRIRDEELRELDREVLRSKLIWFVGLPLIITGLTFFGIYFYNNSETQTNFQNYIIGLFVNSFFWLFTTLIFTKPKLSKKSEAMKNEIERKVDERLQKEIDNDHLY